MKKAQDRMRRALALPLEQQREALWPLYVMTYDAYGRDWRLNTAAIADDYEFVIRGSRTIPGFGAVLGRDAYIEEHGKMLEVLDLERIALDDLRPLGGGRVAAFVRFILRAGDGTIDQQVLDHHEFRDGLLLRQTVWFDREEGMRELGL